MAALEWSADQESLYANCFAPLGFRRAQFSRLLRVATFERAGDDEADVLTTQVRLQAKPGTFRCCCCCCCCCWRLLRF